jgi:DNA-directed RNA polymerase specialized sigma24 family protein
MSRDHASAEQRFRCLYAEHLDPILGFATRRADQADDAADIVAETFLVAGDGSTRQDVTLKPRDTPIHRS